MGGVLDASAPGYLACSDSSKRLKKSSANDLAAPSISR
jgi:hypothetical protein